MNPRLDIGLPMSMDAKKGVIFFFVISESLVLAAIGETAGVGTDFSIFSVLNRLGILNIALHVFFLALPWPGRDTWNGRDCTIHGYCHRQRIISLAGCCTEQYLKSL